MHNFQLSIKAESDLGEIADYTIGKFGILKAGQYKEQLTKMFKRLAEKPSIGRTYYSRYKNLYRYNYKAHVIFYKPFEDHILIYRILGGQMDFEKHL